MLPKFQAKELYSRQAFYAFYAWWFRNTNLSLLQAQQVPETPTVSVQHNQSLSCRYFFPVVLQWLCHCQADQQGCPWIPINTEVKLHWQHSAFTAILNNRVASSHTQTER
jgi:hypothetical protein